jgi:hypothetical protein
MARPQVALLQVHASVFLFGMSGLFGKFLALPATVIVLGRTGFATLALGLGVNLGGRRCACDRAETGWVWCCWAGCWPSTG